MNIRLPNWCKEMWNYLKWRRWGLGWPKSGRRRGTKVPLNILFSWPEKCDSGRKEGRDEGSFGRPLSDQARADKIFDGDWPWILFYDAAGWWLTVFSGPQSRLVFLWKLYVNYANSQSFNWLVSGSILGQTSGGFVWWWSAYLTIWTRCNHNSPFCHTGMFPFIGTFKMFKYPEASI